MQTVCFLKEILTILFSFQWFPSATRIKFKFNTVYKHDLVPNDHFSLIMPHPPNSYSTAHYTELQVVSRRRQALSTHSFSLNALSQASSSGQFPPSSGLTWRFSLTPKDRTRAPLPQCVCPGPTLISSDHMHGIVIGYLFLSQKN